MKSAYVGSSPPARGTQQSPTAALMADRFIPACAGNTGSVDSGGGMRSVHPRLRGEHASRRDRVRCAFGSSPPARGTLRVTGNCDRDQRFIPACAGNTPRPRPPPAAAPVHPRLRGEHVRTVTGRAHASVHPRLRGEHCVGAQQSQLSHGSSPPARGTRHRGCRAVRCARFIPACAGNTPFSPPEPPP